MYLSVPLMYVGTICYIELYIGYVLLNLIQESDEIQVILSSGVPLLCKGTICTK